MNDSDKKNSETKNTTNSNTSKKWIAGLAAATVLGGGTFLLTRPSSTDTATSSGLNGGSSQCSYSCSGPDLDCADFSSHSEAQEFFDCCGFTETNDPMKLDSVGVGNGVACESI